MKNIRILVLEDDLETVESIFSVFRRIEDNKKISFAITILPDYISKIESQVGQGNVFFRNQEKVSTT